MVYILIFTHWIADFILQTDKQAKGKSTSIIWLSKHIAVYTTVLLIFGWKFALANGAVHFVIDFFTSKVTRYLYQKGDTHNFFVVIGFDQALHLSCLIYTMPLISWSLP